MKQGKVVICNIIMMAISVAAIVTLIIGSFMTVNLKLNIDGEKMSSVAGNEGTPEEGTPGEGEGAGSEGDFLKDIQIELPIKLEMKSLDLIKSISENPEPLIKDTINGVTGSAVDAILAQTDVIMTKFVTVAVDEVVKQAEEQVKNELIEQLGEENVTEEQIKEKLETDYGVSESDVETLKNEASDALKALLNGEEDNVADCLEKSETLDNLIKVYAEEELKKENGGAPVTQEQIDAKAAEIKSDTVSECEQAIEDLKVDGELNKETVVVGALSQAGIKDENGNEMTFDSIDDVKAYITDYLYSAVPETAAEYAGTGMKVLGIFILIVIAAWAYFLIKLIVKTLFSKYNKTVGMFFPKFFGWMPHVFFVGLPMLLFNNLDKIAEIAETQAGMEGLAETVATLTSFAEINIASLTWVSALCSVLLLVIWIPYYQWRRRLKRMAKNK